MPKNDEKDLYIYIYIYIYTLWMNIPMINAKRYDKSRGIN